jgi:hypothetical protein
LRQNRPEIHLRRTSTTLILSAAETLTRVFGGGYAKSI